MYKTEREAIKVLKQKHAESGDSVPSLRSSGKRRFSEEFFGVFFDNYLRMWVGLFSHDGFDQYAGSFGTEVEAAKAVNQLCEDFEIDCKNPQLEVTFYLLSLYYEIYVLKLVRRRRSPSTSLFSGILLFQNGKRA